MPISLLLRRPSLLLLVGVLAGCRSGRLTVVLPVSPNPPFIAETTHHPIPVFGHPPKSIAPTPTATALTHAAPPLPTVVAHKRAQQAMNARHFPVLRRQLVAVGRGPATRRHDPRPRHFIHLWLTLSIILTILLGLTIWGAVSAGLVGGILLGLVALVLAGADVVAIGGLLAGLADL